MVQLDQMVQQNAELVPQAISAFNQAQARIQTFSARLLAALANNVMNIVLWPHFLIKISVRGLPLWCYFRQVL
ncbi:hypothetical protein BN132_855 [Cronobacter turicensis 564]|nr:hypothetical protein BN132_855 [Cronobacter turicensis 564]